MHRSAQSFDSDEWQSASVVGDTAIPKNDLQNGQTSIQVIDSYRDALLRLSAAIDDFEVSITFKSSSTAEPTADEARLLLDALGSDFWDTISIE